MTILTATFLLDPREPEDYQVIVELRANLEFNYNGQRFEASSIQNTRNGLKLTAKAVN